MGNRKRIQPQPASIVHDGKLTEKEALMALRIAAQSATDALPLALAKCTINNDRVKIMADRDTVVLAYLNSLRKTLIQTEALFEKTAADLMAEAEKVRQASASLQNASDAINLMAGLIRLAGSLALAFG